MSKLFFLQKRNSSNNNEYILFSSYRMSFKFTNIILEDLKKNSIYNDIIGKYKKDLVEIYFKKLIFYELLPLTNQIVLNNYNKDNNLKIATMDLSSLSSINIFKILEKKGLIKFKTNVRYYLIYNNIKKILKSIISFKKKLLTFIFFLRIKKFLPKYFYKKIDNNTSNIAVYYAEGLIESKKSDLFWYDSDLFSSKNIIIYLDDIFLLNKHQNFKINLDFIKNNNFQLKFYSYNSVKTKLVKNNKKYLNNLDKWILKISSNLDNDVNNWYLFFKENNVKIHLDPTEYGLATIIKHIALDKLNACTIGKLRSYPSELDGKFLGYYTNDIFFTWGDDSTNHLYNSENQIKNFIKSGYPYKIYNNKLNEVNEIKKNFSKYGVKFTILLLDTNHSNNHGHYFQYIPTEIIVNFFREFINLLYKDKEIGIIIKSKKNIVHKNHVNINEIFSKAIKTNRFYYVEEPFQTLPLYYSNISNITVGVGTFISSALMECVNNNDRCIYYDFANNVNNLKNLYNNGSNKFIFNSLTKIINKIVEFKNNSNENLYLGDWSHQLKNLKSFDDYNGSNRISDYIRYLKNNIDNGNDKISAIKNANNYYSKKYGNDKIISK